MARPHKERKIEKLPPVSHFKPIGIPLREIGEITLTFEEMEAVRLADVEQLDQAGAAERMEVSRSTFHRILSKAHQKIALALWEGKAIRFEGGTFRIEHKYEKELRYFICQECRHEWTVPYGTRQRGIDMNCPRCQSGNIQRTK
ncbi:hypothetical protein SCACP_28920 [Sporomusa carbonis]|uniref:DUF134 domain-containing protein n=1 Tax=Sporomusa carbonis TaxID=3076075 RepID=UPI003A721FE0